MNIDDEIVAHMTCVPWFRLCGNDPSGAIPFHAERVLNVADAISAARSPLWSDARTQAQADLTGYLARNHPDLYGGHWNRLAKTAHERIANEVMPRINVVLAELSASALTDEVALDLCRIVVQASYRRRLHRIPDFFERLFEVYESGHLPCGWIGDLNAWPKGTLVVF